MALTLTRIFLHHWHRFRHVVIEVDGSFYLAGHNGSGKSSVLDAIQLVLVADLQRVRFNRLADEHSDRNLDSYVRGKLGEDRWLRDFDTVGYVALEFATPDRLTAVTAGVCIEASPEASAERTHFLLSEPLDPSLLVPDGKNGLSRRDLKKVLKNRPKASVYDPDVESYQQDLLTRLGNLNPTSFYELFLRALHFRPEPNISRFVEQWVLGDKRIDTQNLVAVRARLADLQADAQRVTKRVQALAEIVAQQEEVRRLLGLRNQWAVVAAWLRVAQAERERDDWQVQRTQAQNALAAGQIELAETQAAQAQADDRFQEIQRQLFGNSTRQEAERLDRRIRELTDHVAQLQARRRRLQATLVHLTGNVRLLGDTRIIEAAERLIFNEWEDALRAFDPGAPPPAELAPALAALIGVLQMARDRASEALTRLKDTHAELTSQMQALQAEFDQLKAKGRRQPDRQAERLRERLASAIGVRPLQLWEALEIPSVHESWQDAVEVMLGGRRFHFIVPMEQFRAAARELRRARQEENIFELGLIDLERAARDARPARPGSLAQFVRGGAPAVQTYVDHVLGDIIACAQDEELRQHRRAITADLMLYAEWVQRPLRAPDLFIGQQAVQRRLRALETELGELASTRAALEQQRRELSAALGLLQSRDDLVQQQPELEVPLDDKPLAAELGQTRAAREALDLSGLAELERQKADLEALLERSKAQLAQLQKRQGSLERQLENLASELSEAEQRLGQRQQELGTIQEQYPEASAAAERLVAERQSRPDLGAEIRIADNSRQSQETQATNARSDYVRRASLYNNTENFAGNFEDDAEPTYAAERQRLEATDLPAYRDKIAEAEQEADRELREHVLHSLRDSIEDAKHKLRSLNEALRRLPPFRNEKYRFQSEVNREQEEFYNLIMNSAELGDQPLQGSLFYQQNQAVFERFFDIVTHPPASAADQHQKDYERLLDYRRYLTYDIVVTDTQTQHEDRLSKIIHQRSGGETQAPFYLTIAASFLQLYRVQERTQRPTLRLVMFDEAFSKMDQNYIGATLDMFHQFGLQIVTATPLERCEYIAPKVRTSLVLTAVGNSVDLVKLDDYRNFHAPNPAAGA